MDSKFKLTKLERNWIFYDVANSAFTLMVSTLIPIFFNSLAESEGVSSVDYLAYWGYSISLSTLTKALLIVKMNSNSCLSKLSLIKDISEQPSLFNLPTYQANLSMNQVWLFLL